MRLRSSIEQLAKEPIQQLLSLNRKVVETQVHTIWKVARVLGLKKMDVESKEQLHTAAHHEAAHALLFFLEDSKMESMKIYSTPSTSILGTLTGKNSWGGVVNTIDEDTTKSETEMIQQYPQKIHGYLAGLAIEKNLYDASYAEKRIEEALQDQKESWGDIWIPHHVLTQLYEKKHGEKPSDETIKQLIQKALSLTSILLKDPVFQHTSTLLRDTLIEQEHITDLNAYIALYLEQHGVTPQSISYMQQKVKNTYQALLSQI